MAIIDTLLEKRRRVKQDPDVKDKAGTQPDVYYKGLSKSTKDKRDAHFKKHSKIDDDNPAAYKPAPGDATAKTKPSKHTKKFDKQFGEDSLPDLEDLMIHRELEERYADKMRAKTKSQQKAHQKAMMKSARKSIKDYDKRNKNEEIEEGKYVASTSEIISAFTNMVKSNLGKTFQKSEEEGITLMNNIGRYMKGVKVSKSHKHKNHLYLKSSLNLSTRAGQTEEVTENVDIKKALKKVKGLTKDQMQVLATMNTTQLSIIINQLSSLVMGEDKEEVKKESLWANIHKKRKEGRPMRKPGSKGAPKPGDFERARGEK